MRLGIDPGITGALALVSGIDVLEVWDMPTYSYQVKKKSKTMTRRNVDGWALYQLILQIMARTEKTGLDIVIEAQQHNIGARRKNAAGEDETRSDTAMTAGKIMYTYAVILTAVEIALKGDRSYTIVYPASWKRRAGLIGQDKQGSIAHCLDRFNCGNYLTRKKDHNRADAICIAYYGL